MVAVVVGLLVDVGVLAPVAVELWSTLAETLWDQNWLGLHQLSQIAKRSWYHGELVALMLDHRGCGDVSCCD